MKDTDLFCIHVPRLDPTTAFGINLQSSRYSVQVFLGRTVPPDKDDANKIHSLLGQLELVTKWPAKRKR
jgi:hypothetical protein